MSARWPTGPGCIASSAAPALSHGPALDVPAFPVRIDLLLQRLLVDVTVATGVEMAGPLPDDRTRDCHHLGIDLAPGAAELWRPNFVCGAQCEQRHPRT